MQRFGRTSNIRFEIEAASTRTLFIGKFVFALVNVVDLRVTRCQVSYRLDIATHRPFRSAATMRLLVGLLVTAVLVSDIVCPPVNQGPAGQVKHAEEDLSNSEPMGLAYEHYLKEVVSALEKDEEFKKKLESANTSEIVSGEIARHLEFVSHNVRTKLDELKRTEVERLQAAIRKKQHMKDGLPEHKQVNEFVGHVDHRNPHTFEVEDLEKLIKKATGDLDQIDKKRRSEFKEYEMEKKVETDNKLKKMNVAERAAEQKKLDDMKRKHNDHPKVHHPGSKDQLEEVWEGQDGMDKKDFDPKTFFYLHDVNGDGFLDENEVESLFQKELDKLYDPNAPEDDQMERYEEMNRMREHVIKEIDKNDDRMVSLDEFIESTKRASYEKDEGWNDIEDEQQFSDEEFEKFQKEYHEKQKEVDDHAEQLHKEVEHMQQQQQQQQHQQPPPVQQGQQQGQQAGQPNIQPPPGQPVRQAENHQQPPQH